MSFWDFLSPSSGGSKTSMPKWLNKDLKSVIDYGFNIASQPYQPYPYARIAGFSGDQNKAMGMLRGYAPEAKDNARAFDAPRLIDNINGPGKKAGSIDAYMSPYIDKVLDRTESRIGDMATMQRKFGSNAEAVASNAFGDARHGVANAVIADKAMGQMKDAAAEGYSSAYNNAMELRNSDINRMFQEEQLNSAKQDDFLGFIDSLFRSGSQKQNLQQRNADLAYQDFLHQQGYPKEQFNMLLHALSGTPYNKTTTETEASNPMKDILSMIVGGASLLA